MVDHEWDCRVVPINTRGDRNPLFCVHPGGGLTQSYSCLPRRLGMEQPCYAFEAAGIRRGTEPRDRIEAMAGSYIKAMRRIQAYGPYALVGLCVGGIIAFEMAQQLLRDREHVSPLIMLESHIYDGGMRATVAKVNPYEKLNLPNLVRSILWGYVPDRARDLAHRADEVQLTAGLMVCQEMGILPVDCDLEMLRGVLRVLRSTFRAAIEYIPQPYAGRIVLLRASQDLRRRPPRTAGWASLARGGVELHVVPGTYTRMLMPPAIERTSRYLNLALEAARGRIS